MIGNAVAGFVGVKLATPGFDPNSISGLRLWYDADDSSTITVASNRVSAITNKATGYAATLTQATSGQQPFLAASTQNSKQVIQFAASRTDQLGLTGTPMSGATAQTAFLAHKTTSSTTGYKFVYGQDANGISPLYYQLSSKNYYETGSGVTSVTGTNNVVNTAQIMQITQGVNGYPILKTWSGGSAIETINGNSGTWSVASSANFTRLGAGWANCTDFNFFEVIVYNTVLSAGDQTSVINYLTTKWAI